MGAAIAAGQRHVAICDNAQLAWLAMAGFVLVLTMGKFLQRHREVENA